MKQKILLLLVFSSLENLLTGADSPEHIRKQMPILPTLRSGDHPEPTSKLLKVNPVSTESIQIHLDLTNIEEGTKPEEISFVIDLLVPMAIDRIQSFLSVTGTHQVGPLRSGSCKDDDIPVVDRKYYEETIEGDMIIFVGIRKLSSGILAYSATCAQDASSGRPAAGQMIFNSIHAHPQDHYLLNSYATLVHELLHSLGFNPALYRSFSKVDGGYGYYMSGSAYFMIGRELVKQAKSHFDCDTIDDIKMEDEGDSGSSGAHFERLHFGNETMVSEDIVYPVLSVFTLALFKDSGFYNVNMDKAQIFHWGKDRGCSFLKGSICSQSERYSEICSTKDALGCDDTYNFITRCKSTKFTNNCYVNDIAYSCHIGHSIAEFKDAEKYPKSISHFGSGARCMNFKEDGEEAVTCMRIECASDAKSYKIFFDDETFYNCLVVGQEITYDDFEIKCLDPAEFCKEESRCPQNCNFNGECLLDGTCFCNPFFSGESCAEYVGCPSGIESICDDVVEKNKFGGVGIQFFTVVIVLIILSVFL